MARALLLIVVLGACTSLSQADGLAVARDAGCLSCHTETNTELAPTWVDLWGSEVTLDDGSVVTVDETYVRRSIEEPDAQVVEGYRPTMPLIELTDEEKDLLVSYIRSLS